MVIGILWGDKLTPKMFVDFYRKIYLGGGKPFTIAPSYFNSLEVMERQVADALGRGLPDVFVLMEVPEAFRSENTPRILLERCDILIRFRRCSMEPEALKEMSADKMGVLARWTENILRNAAIQK